MEQYISLFSPNMSCENKKFKVLTLRSIYNKNTDNSSLVLLVSLVPVALPTGNIRLPRTNTLAYLAQIWVVEIKGLMILTHGSIYNKNTDYSSLVLLVRLVPSLTYRQY